MESRQGTLDLLATGTTDRRAMNPSNLSNDASYSRNVPEEFHVGPSFIGQYIYVPGYQTSRLQSVLSSSNRSLLLYLWNFLGQLIAKSAARRDALRSYHIRRAEARPRLSTGQGPFLRNDFV